MTIVDGNVILFNTDSIYQSAYGIAITRNNSEPKYSYEAKNYSQNSDVYFKKENIHSLSGDGELMLTILASFAQEEMKIANGVSGKALLT